MFEDKKDFQYYLTCNPDFSLSKGSVSTYVNNVETFFKHHECISQERVDNYYLMLKENHCPSYINVILNSLRHYVGFRKLDIKIPKEIKKIKNDTKQVVTYDYLINDIFGSVDIGDFHDTYQTKAILIFMFYTGLRLQDYMNLHRSNFVFKEDYGYTTVYVKKNKFNKKIFFPKTAIKYIVNYFDTTEEIDNAFNLKQTTLKNLLNRLDGMVSDIHLHPHIFRGSAINYLYHDCKWEVEKIAKIIGITPETIWNNYLKISMKEIEDEYATKMKGK